MTTHAPLPPWLEPNVRAIQVRGERWSTDGFAAWAVEPPETAPAVQAIDPLESILTADMTPLPFDKRERVNGYWILNDARIVRAHLLDYAEHLFPGITWKLTVVNLVLVGFRADRPRSVILHANPKTPEKARADRQRGGYPACWTCSGTGGDYCEHCDRGTLCPDCEGAHVRKDWCP